MNTYFIICVKPTQGSSIELGPYVTLNEAMTVLSEHIPSALYAHGHQEFGYSAELQEVSAIGLGQWSVVDVKIKVTEE